MTREDIAAAIGIAIIGAGLFLAMCL